ncbi:MAG: hypothetical protein OEY14_17490, partial [Myxococcales bacterium]|nr:hypothetical protein [Myxococcales bacterium]
AAPAPAAALALARPVLPAPLEEIFIGHPAGSFAYQAGMLSTLRLRYVHARAGIDTSARATFLVPLADAIPGMWSGAAPYDEAALNIQPSPLPGARFVPLPSGMLGKAGLRSIQAELKRMAHEEQVMLIGRCPAHGLYSRLGEDRPSFAARVALAAREARDAEVRKLEARHGSRIQRLRERLRKALQKVEKEREDVSRAQLDTYVSVGTGVLGSLFGSRSVRSAGRTARGAARGLGRGAKERADVARAQQDVLSLQAELEELEEALQDGVARLHRDHDAPPSVEEQIVRPRKGELEIIRLALAWVPVPHP